MHFFYKKDFNVLIIKSKNQHAFMIAITFDNNQNTDYDPFWQTINFISARKWNVKINGKLALKQA